MSIQNPLALLPHGTEFRFIDHIDSLEPGQSATASYTIKGTEHFLAGHFPNHPIMPGVILLEALAQLGGIVAQTDPALAPMQNVRLTAVKQAKILGSAPPGDTLTIHAKLDGRMGSLAQISGEVYSPHACILKASIVLSGDVANKD